MNKNKTITLTPDELEDIIIRAVEKALSKAIPLLLEEKKTTVIAGTKAESIVEPITSMTPKAFAGYNKIKTVLPINKPFIAKKKERKNGYAAAFGLPSVITEVIHLHNEATWRGLNSTRY